MMINGRPRLACRTLTKDFPDTITLMPLPAFKLIKDLSVNTGEWFAGMTKRVESWVHSNERDMIFPSLRSPSIRKKRKMCLS